MTWDEILALEDQRLNLAIEEHCYGRRWQVVTAMHRLVPSVADIYEPTGLWIRREEDPQAVTGEWAIGQCPHQHLCAWNAAMGLAWHYGLSVRHMGRADGAEYWWVGLEGKQGRVVHTEAEARRAVCQVALWVATGTTAVL